MLPGLRTSVSAGRVSPLWLPDRGRRRCRPRPRLARRARSGVAAHLRVAPRQSRQRVRFTSRSRRRSSRCTSSPSGPAHARSVSSSTSRPPCSSVPLILCAGSLPAFFAGWGAREIAAAGLYHLSGLRSGDGASASVLFGLVSLVASAPGIFCSIALYPSGASASFGAAELCRRSDAPRTGRWRRLASGSAPSSSSDPSGARRASAPASSA